MATSTPNAADDTLIATVRDYFENFLTYFTTEPEHRDRTSTVVDETSRPYQEQIETMRESERTTLFVDYSHLDHFDVELADAVKEQFHYLEPHLRLSVGKVMASLSEAGQAYAQDKEFHVSFFNLPHLCCIRELRTDKIATLTSFTGTVTRTTDVRPELMHGVFTCAPRYAAFPSPAPLASASCVPHGR